MSFLPRVSRLLANLRAAIASARGKEFALFLLFLGISYIFWLMLTLNNETHEDIDVPITFYNVPDSVTMISEPPTEIKVSVRDKGSALFKYQFGEPKTMKINWLDYATKENKLLLNSIDLSAKLRDYFGSGSQIQTVTPDSISILFTTNPGRLVAVRVEADLHPAFGKVIYGPITSNVDSVRLYSIEDLPHSLTAVETQPIVRGNLSDTTSLTVRIRSMHGVRIIPDHIKITIPVEPLISRKQSASVIVKNLPDSLNLITFPSRVEVSYLIPMSLYSKDPYEVNAYVDYKDSNHGTTSKLPVTLSLLPDIYQNTDVTPDSVEYVIERKSR